MDSNSGSEPRWTIGAVSRFLGLSPQAVRGHDLDLLPTRRGDGATRKRERLYDPARVRAFAAARAAAK